MLLLPRACKKLGLEGLPARCFAEPGHRWQSQFAVDNATKDVLAGLNSHPTVRQNCKDWVTLRSLFLGNSWISRSQHEATDLGGFSVLSATEAWATFEFVTVTITVALVYVRISMDAVTQLLLRIEAGDSRAPDELLPLVYDQLRRLAAQRLGQEKPGQTLQATALVHEAYLRLADGSLPQQWTSRGHFFAAAAEAMRRILIENARSKKRIKRGGNRPRVDLDESCTVSDAPSDDVLALNEALDQLQRESPPRAKLVKLRYFAGLTIEEAAAAMNISPSTAKRYWAYSRAWLYHALAHREAGNDPS